MEAIDGTSPLIFSLQALLVRHESYIADSERDRKAMSTHIEMLEAEKQTLEKRNATVIEENRSLLDQLEAVNTAVSDSDAHVVNLQATLHSAQVELQKLSHLASRTESLEKQLAEFEREQAVWQSSYESKEESEKSAVRRWQTAERTLANLQDEIERIEREASEEKDRHGEIVERMERRHNVEKELGSAAGRLKGAAAAKNGTNDGASPNVVSHFVKDILQDNANLQMGIVELREMLNTSNEEVENLRKQVQLHQPLDEEEERPAVAPTRREDLREELTRANSSELHVHHHYHAPTATPKAQSVRKPRKKRYGAFTPGHFTPPSRSGTPRSSFSHGSPTPTAAILQQTAASIPQPIPQRNRWSMQSNQTYLSMVTSSGPSSPQSTTNRTSSLFDRVFSDAGMDSSRPTTPDTEDPGSPIFLPTHAKRGSQGSFRTNSAPVMTRGGISSVAVRPTLDSILSVEELPKFDLRTTEQEHIIPEEEETDWENSSSPTADPRSGLTSPVSDELITPLYDQPFYHRPGLLRRATSHESILSISGADIHTLKSRPSQLLAPYQNRGITSLAALVDTTVHASRPAAMSRPSESSKSLLTGMAADQRQQAATGGKGVGKKVGGWIFGKWGAAPTPAPTQRTEPRSSTTPKGKDKAQTPSEAAEAIKKAALKPRAHAPVVTPKPAVPGPSSAAKPIPKAKAPIETSEARAITAPSVQPKAASLSSPSDYIGSFDSATPKKNRVRSPGINQMGPISGFFEEVRTPIRQPVVNSFDERALKDVLGGT